MSTQAVPLDIESLRCAIQLEYAEVAEQPELRFHFLVGRPLAALHALRIGLVTTDEVGHAE